MKKIVIVDYGAGNIANVIKALDYCGLPSKLSSDPKDIINADGLIIPGVGAYALAMSKLNENDLVLPIKKYARSNKPILGICLGMQLLFDGSSEFGSTEGLGLIPGQVVPLPKQPSVKVPQMGWNQNQVEQNSKFVNGLDQRSTYFVHSYYVKTSPEYVAASVDFGDIKVPSVVIKNNILGTQFHPEKSGDVGLELLINFKNMVNDYDISSN